MNIAKYLDQMKNIQDIFLAFLENGENIEDTFNNLNILDEHDLKLFLHFISSICDNYYHGPTFFDKIKLMLQHFKDDIKKYYSNSEIFNVFIMKVDEYVAKIIVTDKLFTNMNCVQYFLPEIKVFENRKWFPKYDLDEYLKNELPDDFDEMRNKGENESFICKLVREDLVEDFIAHFNKTFISPNSTIDQSIYETNSFLLEKPIHSKEGITLIEYAAFFGSIQIFTFFKKCKG